MIRVLCCGGRNYNDLRFVILKLDELRSLHGELFIIHGGANGADTLCGQWAAERGFPVAVVPANWKFHDKKAGALRNGWMLELLPNIVVAFPGGYGTSNMIMQAKKLSIPVWEPAK